MGLFLQLLFLMIVLASDSLQGMKNIKKVKNLPKYSSRYFNSYNKLQSPFKETAIIQNIDETQQPIKKAKIKQHKNTYITPSMKKFLWNKNNKQNRSYSIGQWPFRGSNFFNVRAATAQEEMKARIRRYSTESEQNWSRENFEKQLEKALNTSQEEFKKKLRDLEKENHPDTGGSHEAFIALQQAADKVLKTNDPLGQLKEELNKDVTREQLNEKIKNQWLRAKILEDEYPFNRKNPYIQRRLKYSGDIPKYYQFEMDDNGKGKNFKELVLLNGTFVEKDSNISSEIKEYLQDWWLDDAITKDYYNSQNRFITKNENNGITGYYELKKNTTGIVTEVTPLVLENGNFVMRKGIVPLEVYQQISDKYILDPSLPGAKEKKIKAEKSEEEIGYQELLKDREKFNEENHKNRFRKFYEDKNKHKRYFEFEIDKNGKLKKVVELIYQDKKVVKKSGTIPKDIKQALQRNWLFDRKWEDMQAFNKNNPYKYRAMIGDEYCQIRVKESDISLDAFAVLKYEDGRFVQKYTSAEELKKKDPHFFSYGVRRSLINWLNEKISEDKFAFNSNHKNEIRIAVNSYFSPRYYEAHIEPDNGNIVALYLLKLGDGGLWEKTHEKLSDKEWQEVAKALTSRN